MTYTDVTPPDANDSVPVETAATLQPAQPLVAHRRSPLLPIIGGAIAALFGFALALVVPSGWPIGSGRDEIAALQAMQQVQTTELQTLAARVEKPSDTSALTSQIEALRTSLTAAEASVAAQAQAMAGLADRVATAEQQPLADGNPSPAALTAFAAELKSLRDLIEAQQGQGGTASTDLMVLLKQTKAELAAASDKASQLQSQFEQTATRATSRAAMLQINSALETGGPFAGSLEDLAAMGIAVPESLLTVAEGVPSLATLQTGFIEPSRAALSAALKATVGDDAMSRISAFVRNQVGARSLTAREGTDPDAILSRADAALQQGDLGTVLAEIETLPEAGRAVLADWVALAQTRITAMTEVANLATALSK